MPEINSLTKINDKEIPDQFEEKRKTGENDNFICELIRNDSVEEFIVFINKNNISLSTKIGPSIYETNPFLIKNKEQSLIEYAAFFGSFQIFQYLMMNNVNLTSSLWKYVIHGQNSDLIHLLENNHIEYDYEKKIIESIKCHHNKLVNYFLNMGNTKVKRFSSIILKYYNFEYLKKEMINKASFFDLCKNDYFLFVQKFLPKIKINDVKLYVKKRLLKDEFNNDSYFEIKTEKTALHVSVEKENIEIVKLLLTRNDIDVNLLWNTIYYGYDKKNALHIAIEKNNIEIVKLLLSHKKIDVNCKQILYIRPIMYNETPLHIAVKNENIEIVKLLLSCKNIDPNIYWKSISLEPGSFCEEMTAIYWAVKKGNLEIVKILGLNPSTDVKIPFISSIDNGEQVIPERRIILEKKTPLELAEGLKNQEICNVLLMK